MTKSFPLTALQRAYLVGGRDSTGESLPTHLFFEMSCRHDAEHRLPEALKTLLERHETFRLYVADGDAGPVQLLSDSHAPSIGQHDMTDLSDNDREAFLVSRRERLERMSFDPDVLPRYHAEIVWWSASSARLLFACDGMLLDGRSVMLFARELENLLEHDSCLFDPRYSTALRRIEAADDAYARSARRREDLAYWEELVGEADGTDAPAFFDDARDDAGANDGRRLSPYQLERVIPESSWSSFETVARNRGCTPFALALTLYAHVLCRHTSCERFLLNLPQRLSDDEVPADVLGMNSGFLLFPVVDDGARPLVEQAYDNTAMIFDMQDHGRLNGPALVTALSRRRGHLLHAPWTFTEVRDDRPANVRLKLEHLFMDTSQTEIETILLIDGDHAAHVLMHARPNSVPHMLAERMLDMFCEGIVGFASGTLDAQTTSLPLCTRDRRLMEALDNTASPCSAPPMSDLLATSLERHAGRIAVAGSSMTLTYKELAAKCHHLVARIASSFPELERGGIEGRYERGTACSYVNGHHETIGILLPKGPRQLVAVVSCLIGSYPFMPIDPHLPAKAIAGCLDNAGIRHVIASVETSDLLPRSGSCRKLDIAPSMDYDGAIVTDETTDRLRSTYLPHLLCINTSGTTGMPKTISIGDWGMANYVLGCRRVFGVDENTHCIALTNIGHDMALFENVVPLVFGGSVTTLEEDERLEPKRWQQAIGNGDVNTWSTAPAFMQMFNELDEGLISRIAPQMRLCIFGGDFLRLPLCAGVRRHFPHARVFNVAGPAETTVMNIAHEVADADLQGAELPIGTPFPGAGYVVLDRFGRPCPVGVRGGMFISGIGVANGYLRGDELVQDRFPVIDGTTRYDSGDIGFVGEDGEMHICGRDDGQVEVHGKRVELAGVESALLELPGIRQAVVVEAQDAGRLAAFVTSDVDVDTRDVRARLEETLPRYMLPTVVIRTERLPLTPNMKVDRSALKEMLRDEASAERGEETTGDTRSFPHDETERGDVEEALLEIVGSLFGRHVSLDDNYYLLGGDSLLAMRIAAEIERRLGAEVAVYDLLGSTVLSSWVDLIVEKRRARAGHAKLDIERARHKIAEVVTRYLPAASPELGDDFLALGGTTEVARIVARELSVEFGVDVSAYRLVFRPHMNDWPDILAEASWSTS